jgi:general stress protein YciG
MTENQPKPRGFATMTPERKREIASQGGKTAHAKGTAHTWTSQTAAEAGRKGGTARAQRIEAHRALQQQNAVQQAQEDQT